MSPVHRPVSFALSLLVLPCSTSTQDQEEPPIRFERSDQVFEPAYTFQVQLSDLDGDGDPDAVLANMRLHDSLVLWNDGTGEFEDSGQKLTQLGHGLALGDLDGDEDLDLFMTCAHMISEERTYKRPSKIYFNDGKGNFSDSGQDLGDTELSGTTASLHDIDGDRDLDALVDYYQHANKIYLNDGRGRFAESTSTYPDWTTFADLDGDRAIDLFVRDLGVGFRTLLNDGSGQFQEHWSMPLESVSHGSVAFGDLDQDGDPDAVLTSGDWNVTHPTLVLWNVGGGRFEDSGQCLSGAGWGRVAIGDLDEDDYPDAVIAGANRPTEVWLNDGAGFLVDTKIRLGQPDQLYAGIALKDLDDDGDLDVFLANFSGGRNEVWFQEF